MHDERDTDWPTLTRYLLGDATPDERTAIEAWGAAVPGRLAELEELRCRWTADSRSEDLAQRSREWLALARTLGLNDGVVSTIPGVVSHEGHETVVGRVGLWGMRNQGKRTLLRGVLMGAIAAGLAIAVWTYRQDEPGSTPPMATHAYTTTTGQQAMVTLADGSTVTLAPRSRLIVANNFGTATRTLELDGQGYFNVATSSGTPFIVRAGTVGVRVLGTAFDVRHYAGESAVEIAVIQGRVAATSPHASATLVAGRFGRVTDSTVTTTPVTDIKQYTGWTQGRLVFDATPIPAMLAALSRWYGYDFRLADTTLAKGSVSAEFRTGRPDEAMTMLKDVLNVTLTFNGRIITLHPRRGAQSAPTRNTPTLLPNFTEVGK